jgi:inhibitor of Bruton tyrosine kinase
MQFVKVNFSTVFTTQITSVASCGDELMILANSHLYHASIQHKVPKMYQLESDYQEYGTKRDIAQFICSKLSIKRVQHLSNVKEVCCDNDGESFIALLSHVSLSPKNIEKEVFDFSMLLNDDLQYNSKILDVVFLINNQPIRASRFVVAARCEYLKNLMKLEQQKADSYVVEDQRLTYDMFTCILIWTYKNSLSKEDFDAVICKMSEKHQKEFVNNLYEVSLEWRLDALCDTILADKNLSKFLQKQKSELKNSKKFKWFSIESFPQLYDVTILLDENQRIHAHKVVLVMRIEYFRMMFFHSWSENAEVDLKHISISYMKPIIQFAYDNNAESLRSANFTDNYMYNCIAICDQYLIENVKNIFESMIMKKVNLRNCAENLEFSFMYNCILLRDYCMEFICINLARLLEGNVLENLENDILRQLSSFYRSYYNFETDSSRIITPAFDAPTDEEIDEKIAGFNLEAFNELTQHILKTKTTPKAKTRLSKSELLKRGYEKEGIKNIRPGEEKVEGYSTRLSESEKSAEKQEFDWQRNRERKDSGKKKCIVVASKCNEILKNEAVLTEPMIDLRNFKSCIEEDIGPSRVSLTLADFGFKDKRKSAPASSPKVEEKKELTAPTAWNMSSIELKPTNLADSDPFRSIKEKKNVLKTKTEKKFSSIIRDERKDKSNFEKIKSKSLILTQIEEKAIIELSQFYNIENIFDENIKIYRKEHPTSQNMSQWQYQTKSS